MRSIFLGTWVLSLAMVALCHAQLPHAQLVSLYPPGLQSSKSTEMTVTGSELDGPGQLLFSHPGLTAISVPGREGVFTVHAGPEIPAGIYEARFAGRFGVSNPRRFEVSRFAEWILAPTNTLPERALLLPLDTIVNGRTENRMVHWFKFNARKGERIFVEVETSEIDSRLVPDLAVLDQYHQELGTARRSGFLDFQAPSDGSYLLKLHDQLFRGGDEFVYRIRLASGPHLDFALPMALTRGGTNRTTLFGRNLPGSDLSELTGADGHRLEKLDLEIVAPSNGSGSSSRFPVRPGAVGIDGFLWQWSATNGVSNPLRFAFATMVPTVGFAARLESNQVPNLPRVALPVEFAGQFPRRGEASGISFEAHKGDVLWCELYSDRLGFPTDPFAVIQRQLPGGDARAGAWVDVAELNDLDEKIKDRELAGNSRDGSVRFEAPETGGYRVLVRDLLHNSPNSPRYSYLLSLHRESPGFQLVSWPHPAARVDGNDKKIHPIATFLRRGETLPLHVAAFRQDGFGGDIEVALLPGASGISAIPGWIRAGQNSGQILLTASEGATNGWYELQIQGTASTLTNRIPVRARGATVVHEVNDFDNDPVSVRLAEQSIVSVTDTEMAPVRISVAGSNPLEAKAGSKISFPITIQRGAEFQKAFDLKVRGHAALEKAADVKVPEKATNATAEINLAEAQLPEGIHTLWLEGTIQGKYQTNPEAAVLAEAELKAAEKALMESSGDGKKTAEERKRKAEERKKATEERAKPRDINYAAFSQPFIVRISASTAKAETK
jgi:hypothetical protein